MQGIVHDNVARFRVKAYIHGTVHKLFGGSADTVCSKSSAIQAAFGANTADGMSCCLSCCWHFQMFLLTGKYLA